jgi:hypothetical protein
VTRTEIIQALKDNEKPFCKMTSGMQLIAKAIGKNGNFQFLDIAGSLQSAKWVSLNGETDNSSYSPYGTYRLRPGYEEKPETEKCRVCLGTSENHEGKVVFVRTSFEQELYEAINYPDFIGFLYECGNVIAMPRLYRDENGIHRFESERDTIKDFKVLTPTHVLFRKDTNE